MDITNFSQNSIRYAVGGNDDNTSVYSGLVNEKTIREISQNITFQLRNVRADRKPVVIPDGEIKSMLSDVIDTFKPQNVGDIFSREHIQLNNKSREEEIKEMVINSFVNSIRNEEDTIRKNKTWTKMNTVYGDFNQAGLQSYSSSMIKLNEKNNGKTAMFNMRY